MFAAGNLDKAIELDLLRERSFQYSRFRHVGNLWTDSLKLSLSLIESQQGKLSGTKAAIGALLRFLFFKMLEHV